MATESVRRCSRRGGASSAGVLGALERGESLKRGAGARVGSLILASTGRRLGEEFPESVPRPT